MGDLESSVRMFYERFSRGDMDGAASIYHDDVVTVEPALGRATSVAEWRAYGEAFRRASPDAHMVLHTVVEGGDTVAVEATFAGTFTAPLASAQGDVPPTGRAFEVPFRGLLPVPRRTRGGAPRLLRPGRLHGRAGDRPALA
jgi:hypothetical protein